MKAFEKLRDPIRSLVRNPELIEERFDGGWPSFHDAEITGIELDRNGPSARLAFSAFRGSDQVEVQMRCDHIQDMELAGFNYQNVVFEIRLSVTEEGALRMDLDPCFGVTGFIICEVLHVLNAGD